MRKRDSGSVWERAKLPSREGRTRGKARGAALGAAGGIVWGTGQLWAQRLEKGLDKELWGLSRDLLQPAGTPWGADPQGSPTAAGVYRAPKGAVLCAQDSQQSVRREGGEELLQTEQSPCLGWGHSISPPVLPTAISHSHCYQRKN